MFNVHISQRITLKQGDIMDAVYIVTKGSVRLDVNATSDAYTFIRNTLTHQFGHMTTDEIHTLLSASSLDAAAAALIRRFVPVTQLTHSREVHPYFPAQCFIPVFGYNAYFNRCVPHSLQPPACRHHPSSAWQPLRCDQ